MLNIGNYNSELFYTSHSFYIFETRKAQKFKVQTSALKEQLLFVTKNKGQTVWQPISSATIFVVTQFVSAVQSNTGSRSKQHISARFCLLPFVHTRAQSVFQTQPEFWYLALMCSDLMWLAIWHLTAILIAPRKSSKFGLYLNKFQHTHVKNLCQTDRIPRYTGVSDWVHQLQSSWFALQAAMWILSGTKDLHCWEKSQICAFWHWMKRQTEFTWELAAVQTGQTREF